MGTGKDLWYQLETLINNGDRAPLSSLFTRDGVYIAPHMRHEGREAIGAFFDHAGTAFSGNHIEASLVIEDGDAVVAEWRARITHTGPLIMPDGAEIAPTGKTVEGAGVTVGRVRNGKFVSFREYYDTADMTRQLGLTPST